MFHIAIWLMEPTLELPLYYIVIVILLLTVEWYVGYLKACPCVVCLNNYGNMYIIISVIVCIQSTCILSITNITTSIYNIGFHIRSFINGTKFYYSKRLYQTWISQFGLIYRINKCFKLLLALGLTFCAHVF